MKKNIVIISLVSILLLGIGLVSASTYFFNMHDRHMKMIGEDNFAKMQEEMLNGNYEAAEKYHEVLDFECPIHEQVKNGNVSIVEFSKMHEWMINNEFPEEQPTWLSDSSWEIHKSHHAEIYK